MKITYDTDAYGTDSGLTYATSTLGKWSGMTDSDGPSQKPAHKLPHLDPLFRTKSYSEKALKFWSSPLDAKAVNSNDPAHKLNKLRSRRRKRQQAKVARKRNR